MNTESYETGYREGGDSAHADWSFAIDEYDIIPDDAGVDTADPHAVMRWLAAERAAHEGLLREVEALAAKWACEAAWPNGHTLLKQVYGQLAQELAALAEGVRGE